MREEIPAWCCGIPGGTYHGNDQSGGNFGSIFPVVTVNLNLLERTGDTSWKVK